MNLGAFAGGLTQGYQSQEKLNLAQKSQQDDDNIRQRGMAVQEQNAAAQQDDRARQKAFRDQGAQLLQQFYGPQQVPDDTAPPPAAGADGTVPPRPMKTVQFKPGENPENDAAYFMAAHQLAASTVGTNPDDMAKMAEAVNKARGTAAGKQIMGVLAGDTSALEGFAKLMKKDPAGAKIDFNPLEGHQRIVWADGSVTDMKKAAAAAGAADAYNAMVKDEKSAQDNALHKARMDDYAGQAEERRAKAQMYPAMASNYSAEAGEHAAKGNLARAKAANVGANTAALADTKADREMTGQIKSVLEVDPTSQTGKTPNMDQAAYLQGVATQLRQSQKMSPAQAVAAAQASWTKTSTAADQWISSTVSKLSPADRKAKYGTSDLASIKKDAIRRQLGSQFAAAPATSAPAPVTDSADD